MPPPEVLLPAEGEAPAESLAGDNGLGAIADAAFDEGGHTGLFFAPMGRSVADGIIRYDGAGGVASRSRFRPAPNRGFHILAIDATGLGNAWAIAEPADLVIGRWSCWSGPRPRRGRSGWSARSAAHRSPTATPRPGDRRAGPIGGAAQPLTVTADGVWIDLTGTIEGVQPRRHPLLRHRRRRGHRVLVRRGVCAAPARRQVLPPVGYRSFAWPGGGFGTRIVTNPLDPGGGEDTNRGTYLRLRKGPSHGCPAGAAISAQAAPLRTPTTAGSRALSRSRPSPPRTTAALAGLDAGSAHRVTALPARPGAVGSEPSRWGSTAPSPVISPAGMEAGIPALLERRGQQGHPARRRLARTGPRPRGRRPRRDVDVERRRRPLGRRPRVSRSGSKAT